MKILFDQNPSHKLVRLLADIYPDSEHVRSFSLQKAEDDEIWRCARAGGFVLATKDEDCYHQSVLLGQPPKVIWVRSGNCATELVETLLSHNQKEILRFEAQSDIGFLELD